MNDLTPSQKGAVAEAAITAAAIQLGLVVLRPLSEGGRYDLMIDLDPALLRVQCKLARVSVACYR
jgi:PD-(D/E)XK endonuclease